LTGETVPLGNVKVGVGLKPVRTFQICNLPAVRWTYRIAGYQAVARLECFCERKFLKLAREIWLSGEAEGASNIRSDLGCA
jgi:hypothetical protein